MKIFISYGHNDYTELVDRLFDALGKEGHEPWKDDRYEGSSGIAAGEDFTEVIYRAIDEADFVVAFVTRSTQDKPYCRDERQYAYNHKGAHFIQVRLDGVEIKLGNARSYIDMSDVVTTTGEISERLFEDRLKALLAAFRDPASFAEGGITPWTKIDAHLKVPGTLKYDEFVANLDGADFVGREWLFEQCKSWALDNTITRRLFVILGEAGTGKTAFVRHLSSDAELVRSVHVCVYDRPSTRTAKDTLRDLAYVLAGNNPSYFAFLKSENLEKIKEMSIDGLFEYLFLDPLRNETGKYLLIIDGLDELEESNGLVPLMKIFRQYADRINPNLSFLLTTRPDEYIVEHLRKIAGGKPLDSVTLNKDVSRGDLLLYIERKLNELGSYSESLANKILDACDGNFEYLSLLFKEAIEEGLSVSEGMQMPRGLNERYAQYLDRRMEANELTRLTKEQRKLLSVMCAANEPIPLSLLSGIADMDEDDVLDELELFGSLVRRSGDKRDPLMSVFTKSFRDFLVSMEYRRYSADKDAGNALIAEYVMSCFKDERDFSKVAYVDKNSFAHLIRYSVEEGARVTEYMKELEGAGVDVALRIADALGLGEKELVDAQFAIADAMDIESAVRNHLTGKRNVEVLELLIESHRENGRLASALVIEATMLLWESLKENFDKAEKLCEEAIELARAEYAKDPCYRTRRILAITIDTLARVIRKRGDKDTLYRAEELSREQLELNTESWREKNSYRTLRDISIAYYNIGMVLSMRYPKDGAARSEEWHRKALEIGKMCYSQNPCNESRRDLAFSYGRLGDLARSKGAPEDLVEAEELFRKQLTLYEENYRENKSYNCSRDLSVACGRLGDLLKAKGGATAVSEAAALFEKNVAVSEENYRENPNYETRRDLSIAYGRHGDAQADQGTPEGNARAEINYIRQLELAEDNYRFNPCYESRRDLHIAYGRVGGAWRKKNTEAGLAEARRMFERQVELSLENLEASPSYESRRDFGIACVLLAYVIERSESAQDIAEAVELYRRRYELSECNYLETPCAESRKDLFNSCEWLCNILHKKGTPDVSAEIEKLLRRRVSLSEECYRDEQSVANAYYLCLSVRALADLLFERDLPEELSETKQLYLKATELSHIIYNNEPTYHNRRALSLRYYRLVKVCDKLGTVEELDEAVRYCSMQFALDHENYKAQPCDEALRDLKIDCNIMISLCKKRNTPEALALAKVYYDFKNKLEDPATQKSDS